MQFDNKAISLAAAAVAAVLASPSAAGAGPAPASPGLRGRAITLRAW
jgi:hypothetical protein